MLIRAIGINLKPIATLSLRLRKPVNFTRIIFRESSGDVRLMPIRPTRYQWNKFKDLVHMYTIIGFITFGTILIVGNYYIGSATLEPIPEGYEPKHWEYCPHFVSRFMARYLMVPSQQDYEKVLAFFHDEDNKVRFRRLSKQIETKMRQREDYKGYYYIDPYVKYIRINREDADKLKDLWGDT